MENIITYQQVLELIREQSIVFNQNLDRERQERELSNQKFNESLEKSRLDFDKKLGEVTGTWGKFVAEMVQPKIVEMFQEKGIQIQTSMQSIKGYIGDEKYYEIDLLLINSNIAVVVEIKSTLTRQDVDDHLARIEKIRKISPKRIDLSGVTILGAVAGMIVENNADRYAYKNGLFVLRQKGNIVEIVNDDKFQPKEWKVEY